MLIAIPVGAGNLWRLRQQPRTPTPEPWVAEVEQALFDVAPAQIDHVMWVVDNRNAAMLTVSRSITALPGRSHPDETRGPTTSWFIVDRA